MELQEDISGHEWPEERRLLSKHGIWLRGLDSKIGIGKNDHFEHHTWIFSGEHAWWTSKDELEYISLHWRG
jgi:hypothetical protein